jgi:hypothetical protein
MVERSNDKETKQETTTELAVTKKCTYIHPDGRRCEANSCLGSPFCWWHNSEVKDRRTDAQRRGGMARHSKTQPAGDYQVESPEDLLQPLMASLNESFSLPNSAAKGKTIANLAGMVLKSLEASNLEARITALENRISKER